MVEKLTFFILLTGVRLYVLFQIHVLRHTLGT